MAQTTKPKSKALFFVIGSIAIVVGIIFLVQMNAMEVLILVRNISFAWAILCVAMIIGNTLLTKVGTLKASSGSRSVSKKSSAKKRSVR